MSGCSCEPGTYLPQPHAPWLCLQNPGWDERESPDCTCGQIFLSGDCPDHGWLIDATIPFDLAEGVA